MCVYHDFRQPVETRAILEPTAYFTSISPMAFEFAHLKRPRSSNHLRTQLQFFGGGILMSYSKSTGVQKVLRRLHRVIFQSVPNTAPLEVDLSRLVGSGSNASVKQESVQSVRHQVSDFSGHVKT
jgi:hypothetical protein